MRTSRLFRLIVRIFLLVLASSMSFVSFLGGYSAALIFTDEKSIDIDLEFPDDFSLDAENFSFTVTFKFNNKGYFDLEDLEIELELVLLYDYVDYYPGQNVTIEETLFIGDKSFKTIEAGQEKENEIEIEPDDLEPSNLTAFFLNIGLHADPYRDPIIEFEAKELIVKAKYSLGLISFKVKIEDFELGDFEGEV